ncbi:MAG TPA: hypothetical protein DDZ67_02905 [Xanthomonadaceae bacterium]|nr:hypothetical protein [Xanthomonadaceae bacterium]
MTDFKPGWYAVKRQQDGVVKTKRRIVDAHEGTLHHHGACRTSASRWRIVPRVVAALVLISLLTACKAEPASTAASAKISAYNHTEDYIHQFYINGQWGGNSRPYGGGGKFTCCINYPRQWQPGLTATVRWTTSSGIPGGNDPTETWHEKVVPIERYEKPGTTLNVHFLPDGQVRLLIWDGSAGSKGYKGPDAPVKPEGWPPKPSKPQDTIESADSEQQP